jgi:hypothetical protein
MPNVSIILVLNIFFYCVEDVKVGLGISHLSEDERNNVVDDTILKQHPLLLNISYCVVSEQKAVSYSFRNVLGNTSGEIHKGKVWVSFKSKVVQKVKVVIESPENVVHALGRVVVIIVQGQSLDECITVVIIRSSSEWLPNLVVLQ